jgi:DNA-binding transcriptional MerR regulator
MSDKAAGAFLTIGELSDSLGLPQHILRYWETRFPQLRPLQRAGKRRYYRPEDVALAQRINRLLNQEGYTIKGVQKLLSQRGAGPATDAEPAPERIAVAPVVAPPAAIVPAVSMLPELRQIRTDLARALADA